MPAVSDPISAARLSYGEEPIDALDRTTYIAITNIISAEQRRLQAVNGGRFLSCSPPRRKILSWLPTSLASSAFPCVVTGACITKMLTSQQVFAASAIGHITNFKGDLAYLTSALSTDALPVFLLSTTPWVA